MQPIKIFFSCAPNSSKDRKYVDALEKHFADQKRNDEVSIWHLYKTYLGSNEQQEILTHLNDADIILIFQSPDYLDNDFCVDVEGAQAASMQTWGIATVRVLRIRSIDSRTAPFNFCEALPESGEFISSLPYKEGIS